jgi:SAM-dependent methyltransferase
MDSLKFACLRCAAALNADLVCPGCGWTYACKDGIYRFLLPDRTAELAPFLTQYQYVRRHDGNLARPADYYRLLPMVESHDKEADRWQIRRQSYMLLLRLLPGPPLNILDLGAGNCWLTHRLAALGHCCVAVDISTDPHDGLGAWHHYAVEFICIQADFDALPYIPNQFEVVIFNASLHYSPDIQRSLAHAKRMLKPNGVMFVVDSPTFHTDHAGRQMLSDQDNYFRRSYGLDEVIRHGVGYLTTMSMSKSGFRFHPSRGSFLWSLGRLWSGIRLRREPANFGVWACKPQ